MEDRRGGRPVGMTIGGGGCLTLVILIGAVFLGADPMAMLGLLEAPRQQVQPVPGPGIDDDTRAFIEVVLRDTETIWTQLFRQHVQGGPYVAPRLVLFSDTERSGCGLANAAMGPFYCPADEKIYIDPTFFDELRRRHQAPGDFAQAYVIAHEVAHHVQKQLGFSQIVDRVRQHQNQLATNQTSVRLELQADYLAGVWAHHAQKQYNILEDGDIAEAMNAANQIGDDTLQRLSQGYVVPQRYTHGTSEQRVRWFRRGLTTGDFDGCQRLFKLDYSEL